MWLICRCSPNFLFFAGFSLSPLLFLFGVGEKVWSHGIAATRLRLWLPCKKDHSRVDRNIPRLGQAEAASNRLGGLPIHVKCASFFLKDQDENSCSMGNKC